MQEADHENLVNGRREFLKKVSSFFMISGLLAGYGAFMTMAVRFLYPSKGPLKGWLFVKEIKRFNPGDALSYVTPEGQKVAIARQENSGRVGDFIALSSTCPHLGCQVHWEGAKERFFCPCHNGAFAPDGTAIAGPPKEANQSLSRYPLKIENGLLFIEVPLAQKGNASFMEIPGGPLRGRS